MRKQSPRSLDSFGVHSDHVGKPSGGSGGTCCSSEGGGGAHGEGWVQINYPPDFTSACLVGISAISQNYFSIKINYLKTITLRKSQCAFRQDKLVPN